MATTANMAPADPVVPTGSLPQDDRSHVVVYVVAAVVPVTALVVCLRFYTRWGVVKSFGTDDWATLVAMVRFPASVSSEACLFELT